MVIFQNDCELKLKDQLDSIQQELVINPYDISLQCAERELVRQYVEVKSNAMSFMKQKAKLIWLREGDENTDIFHRSIKQRQYKNMILRLQNNNGYMSFLKQKAKLIWLREGDENTDIFHRSIKQRQYKNRILRIQNNNGYILSNLTDIQLAFQNYYEDLFRRRDHGI
ncbi:hypothetical protein RIF29_14198 [Crotalaria pallida]|uniref:Uncharacterized protein n=1 Tax=Crotalaria pallida TaxID=3830 RepID=A0AAN9FF02_CROPI